MLWAAAIIAVVVVSRLTREFEMAEEIYSDVNLWAGVLSPYIMVINESAVNQNILVLCDTPVGSKWFRPKIGTAVLAYLFEPFDDQTATAIGIELESFLTINGENRVIIHKVEVIPDWNNMRYYVEINYSAPQLNLSKISFAFYLSKERIV